MMQEEHNTRSTRRPHEEELLSRTMQHPERERLEKDGEDGDKEDNRDKLRPSKIATYLIPGTW